MVGELVQLGEAEHDAVVGPEGLDVEAGLGAEVRLDGQGPGGVDAGAEGREHADPPVAQLVLEGLHRDGAVRGQGVGGLPLLAGVGDEVLRGPGVEAEVLLQPGAGLGVGPAIELAEEGADAAAQLQGSARALAVPEGQAPRLPGCRRHDHAIAGDRLDAPRRGAEHDGLARSDLEDHLLVELAEDRSLGPELDPVEPPIGDRAAVDQREGLGALSATEQVLLAIPGDAGSEVGEGLGRVAAGQHVEHRGEDLAGELLVGVGPAEQRQQVVDPPVVDGDRGHHLLGEHVEAVARDPGRLDRALAHRTAHHRRFEQVSTELGKEPPGAHLAHAVARPPDALEAAGHRARGLHQHHQVHGPHVDAQLQGAGGDQGSQGATLELLLDLLAAVAGDGAVVGPHQVFAGQLVEALGDALAEQAAVGEDDGAGVLLDQLQEPGVDGRPDARALLRGGLLQWDRAAPGPPGGLLGGGPGHVRHWHHDLQVHLWRVGPVHDRDLPAAAQEGRHLLQRPLGRRQPDALGIDGREVGQALQRQRQVHAALGAGHGVDLVDDHRVGAAGRGTRGW